MELENGIGRYDNETALLNNSDARKRLELLYDNGEFTELDRFVKSGDKQCGVITACGYVCGTIVYAFSQDISVCDGAMNVAQALKIKNIYALAEKNGAPVVGIFDSFGAVINEGLDVLDAYGELIKAAGNISGVVPQISVVAGTCIGSAAVLAAQSDVIIMNSSAELCVNSSFIVGDKEGKVGSAELNMQNGVAAVISADDQDAMNMAVKIVSMLPPNNLSVPYVADYIPAVFNGDSGVLGVISSVVDADSFVELFSRRADCVRVGFARIGGSSVGVVATDSTKNNGSVCGSGAVKIARFVRLCDAFSLPVITLLDSEGILGSKESELNGDVKSVAMLTHAYSEATTAKITLITGKAYGSSFTAMAGKASGVDMVFAWPDAVITALNPMTAVQLLYKDRLASEKRENLELEYAATVGSPFSAAANGHINDVIKKEETVTRIIKALEMLESKRTSTLNKKHSNIQL